jgi:hypothetical protein
MHYAKHEAAILTARRIRINRIRNDDVGDAA